jgi:hypothetical protein
MALKTAIYTAVFGDKDEVRDPINYVKDVNIDYFIITDDRDLRSNCYNIIHKEPLYDDITKNARYYKIIGVEEFDKYDFIIWHDANLQIVHEEIPNAIKIIENKGIAFFKHSERNCIYDEAIKCIQLEKDYPFKMLKQLFGYYLKGMKPGDGLYDTSLVVKNSKFVSKEFLQFWWMEIKLKSRRDQLSLPYTLKKFRINPGILEGNREKNGYARFSLHKHSKYNFLSSSKPKSYNKWYKAIAIKIILLLKKMR